MHVDIIMAHVKALESSMLSAEEIAKISNELTLAALEMAPAGEPEVKDLNSLNDAFKKSWGDLKTLLDQQADEIRTHGETHGKTADGIKSVETRLVTLDTEFKGIQTKFTEWETKMNRPNIFGGGDEEKTAGQLFTESDAYKNMMKNGSKSSDSVSVKSFERKATLTSATASTGGIVIPYRVPEIIAAPNRILRIRDLMNVQTTTSNAIDYIRETLFTNASAPTAETNLKPESSLTFDLRTASVKTIPHFIPATRQILADAPMLRNYIDNRLIYGLKLTEENQILYGNGTGENLMGLMVDTGVQVTATPAATPTPNGLDIIRHAITLATLAGYPVTGIVVHPSDWETMELQKSTQGEYIWANVNQSGEQRLWAVPVVQSLGLTQGDYIVGAFGIGSQIWDREEANVRVSEHHADFFARNMVAILAEERLALTTFRPQSFVRGRLAP